MSECDEKFEAWYFHPDNMNSSIQEAYQAAWSESRKSCEQWMAWNGHELADVIVDLQNEVNTLTKLVPKAPERMMLEDLKELREENAELQKELDALKERVSSALCEFSETQKSHKRRSCRMAMALSDGAKEGWSWMWEGEEDENQQLQTQLAETQGSLAIAVEAFNQIKLLSKHNMPMDATMFVSIWHCAKNALKEINQDLTNKGCEFHYEINCPCAPCEARRDKFTKTKDKGDA